MLSFYLCRTFFLVFPPSLLFPHLFKIFKSIRNSTKHLNVFLNRMNEWMRMEALQYTWMNFQQCRRSRALFIKLTIFAHIHTKKYATLKHEIKRSSFQSRNEIIQWEIKVLPWHCGLWCWFLFSRTQFIWNAHCSYRSCGQNWMRHSVTVDMDATRIFVSFSFSTRFSLSTATSFRTPIEQQLICLTVLWKDKENCTYLPNEPKQMS